VDYRDKLEQRRREPADRDCVWSDALVLGIVADADFVVKQELVSVRDVGTSGRA
jgi:hypothetical protein